ncbi:hypothetical protein VB714_27290 [Spirulina sp. 06S082]|nr:hypothetical protein [Spirulina sp. 06S082]
MHQAETVIPSSSPNRNQQVWRNSHWGGWRVIVLKSWSIGGMDAIADRSLPDCFHCKRWLQPLPSLALGIFPPTEGSFF